VLTKSNALIHSENLFSHSKASTIIEYFVSLESSPHPLVSARILFRVILFWHLLVSGSVYSTLICVYTNTIKIISYSPVTPCSLVGNYHTFKGTCLF